MWDLSPENLNVSQGRRRQIKGQISSRPISRIIFSWIFHYIRTYVHCSLVAITTLEGGSWGYLSLQITHPAQERLATPPGSTFPTRFEQRCGIFYIPQEPDKWKCCETRTLSQTTSKSNRLQMSIQKQHFLLSYVKTLSVGPAISRSALFPRIIVVSRLIAFPRIIAPGY